MAAKEYILLLLALTSIIGSLYIYLKKGNENFSVTILAGFLIILGLIFLEAFIINFFGYENSHFLIVLYSYLFFVLCLLLPPTFYLYALSLVKRKEDIRSTYAIQRWYIPAIFLLIINVFSYISLYNIAPDSSNYRMIRSILTYTNFISLLFVFLLQNVFFIYKSWQLFLQQKSVQNTNQVNNSTDLTLRWMGWYISLYTILIIALYIFQLKPLLPGKIVFRIFTFIYIGLLIYFGSNNYQFVSEAIKLKQLDDEKRQSIKDQLVRLMEAEKPYLSSDLTLKSLAQQLGTNSKYLSYLINTEFGCNFSTFINNYRVTAAKKLLVDPDNHIYTIQTILEMTGFKSKSAFNTAFKKATNLTPSKYKLQNLETQ